MKYKEALAKIEDADVKQAISDHVVELMGSSTNAEKDRKTLDTELKTIKAELESVTLDRDRLKNDTELATKQKTELEAKLKGIERRDLNRAELSKINAAPAVIERLIPDLEVQDGKVGDKSLKEYLESNYSEFLPAIFPNQKTEPPTSEAPKPKLPSGKNSGEGVTKIDTKLDFSVPDFSLV